MGLSWSPSSAEVYTTVTGTFTFSDSDTSWVYVDWDDGEDNSLDNAVFQWEKLKTDSNSIALDHTYTKGGTFYPVVRTVNSQGMISKYFYEDSPFDSSTVPEPKELAATLAGITISDGNPTSVMRIENKQVLSGIDNNIFNEGSKDVYVMIPPIIGSGNIMVTAPVTFNIEVDAIVEMSVSYQDESLIATTERFGAEKFIRTISQTISLNDSTVASPAAVLLVVDADNDYAGKISEILEVRLTNPKLLKSTIFTNAIINDYNKLKLFLIAKGNDDLWYPITYVSNGDPIKSIDDVKRTVNLDFSQSRAKASNKSISYYRYSDGKAFWEPSLQWQAYMSGTQFNNNTKTADSLITENYTYYTRPGGLLGSGATIGDEWVMGIYSGNAFSYGAAPSDLTYIRDQFALNEFNQFYDQYHLTRLEAVSDTTKFSGLDTFTNFYRIRPVLSPTGAGGYFITGPSPAPTETSIHTSGAFLNGSGNAINTANWNVGPFVDEDDESRAASEYFLMTNETKFNKIFVNATNLAVEMESNLQYNSGSSIAGVYYLRVTNDKYDDQFTQKAEWVPLKFEDTTKVEKEYRNTAGSTYETKSNTMSKSGYIQFDMPSDWSTVPTISGLAAGFWDINFIDQKVINEYSKLISGTYSGTMSMDGIPWDVYVYEDVVGLEDYTGDDIGSFKYIFHMSKVFATSDGDEGKVWWVASGNSDCTKLFFVSGTDTTTVTPVASGVRGFIRRLNMYEVFDGASKTSDIGSPAGYKNSFGSPPPFEYTWQVGNQQEFVDELRDNFQGYPLKIVISGAANHFISGTGQPGMSIWNMLPFNNASSQVVVQKDNTAYDLTYLEITSDIGVTYAGTYYQAISKNGKVFITRTGTPIQTLNFGGTAMGDESQFKFSQEYTSYGTLRLLKRMQAESVRVMWDEVQKDGTFVRFFGYITSVTETHSNQGPRAPKPFAFNMVVEEICLMDSTGELMSGVIPLGGIKDAANYK